MLEWHCSLVDADEACTSTTRLLDCLATVSVLQKLFIYRNNIKHNVLNSVNALPHFPSLLLLQNQQTVNHDL